MLVNNKSLLMEVDSGAGISVIPDTIYKRRFKDCKLKPTYVRVKTYNGGIIVPEGEIYVSIKFQGICKSECRLIVIKNGTIPLLCRDLMNVFNLNIQGAVVSNMNNLSKHDNNLHDILKKYNELFKNELGLYKYEKVELRVNREATPVFCKPRPIPFAFREMVNKELDMLEKKE